MSDISDFDVMRHSVAWQDEIPLLMQVRNLLAHLCSITLQVHGNRAKPSDFLPKKDWEHSDKQEIVKHLLKFGAKVTEVPIDGIEH